MKKHFATMFAMIVCMFLIGNTMQIVKGEENFTWPSENPNDYTISVTKNDFLEYIEINGEVAYCIDIGDDSPKKPDEKHPKQVVIGGENEIRNVEMMKKLLYYGYGGPGYLLDIHSGSAPGYNSNEARRNTITAYNIHRAAHNSYGDDQYDGNRFPEVTQEWAAISAKELPDWEINLVQGAGELVLVTEQGVEWQRSPQFYLEGGPAQNSVHIPIKAPFQLRKVATGEVFTANSVVEIKVGEAFWIEAPKSYEGTFQTGDLESTMPTKMRLIVLKWGKKGVQRIVVAQYYKGTTSMKTTFPGFLNCVEVEKRDSEDSDILLNGAKFILLKKDTDGTIYYFEEETRTWVLDKELATILETSGTGKVGVKDLSIGEYYFEEVEAAPGYLLPENENERIFPAIIDGAGKVAEAKAFNEKEPVPIDLSIFKVDAQDYQIALPGAELTLYMCTLEHNQFENHIGFAPEQGDGCLVKHQDIISDEYGHILLEGLYSGHYWLVETKAPEGYQLPLEQWRVHVDTAAETINIYNQDGEEAWNLRKLQERYLLLNEHPFQLPFTGMADLRKMSIIGIALMITGMKAYKKLKTYR